MTLKQFFQLGGGALVAIIIYSTGLHPLIKWPLILISVSLGAALAFLPFEERPLSRWIFVFFRSVYSPTIYLWKKSEEEYSFFQDEQLTQPEVAQTEQNYPKTKTESESVLEKLENAEQGLMSRIASIFKQEQTIIPNQNKTENQTTMQIKNTQPNLPNPQTIQKTDVVIPSTTPKSFRPKVIVEESNFTPNNQTQTDNTKLYLHQVSPISQETTVKAQQAQFSPQAAPPLPPTIPNTITGQVIDQEGKIIEGAILEIRDLAGRPVRAIRSNKLGHFMIVTALPNGQYDIITEKEGYEFDPATFEAKGEIIPPILIKAKSKNLLN